MKPAPVIAIFDIGKTNKKLFLFDEGYHIVFERSANFVELTDEDGYPCENLECIARFVFDGLIEIAGIKQFELKAVNFAAYGASFVYLGKDGTAVAPMHNYLKPYPKNLEKQFYNAYGGKDNFSWQTASPALGSLNSGLQLYRIKYERPALFKKIKYALHLPQYLSYLVSGKKSADVTSIGCHTALWDFGRNNYHHWVVSEGLVAKLAPIRPADATYPSSIPGSNYKVGIGLHDSSAALIPYLVSFNEPFILLSTGTWSVSLNPFNQRALTAVELKNDCLFYIGHNGRPVKASRFFIGHEYTGQAQMAGIIKQQKKSTDRILKGTPVKQLFVDGGFSKNRVFMQLLAAAYPGLKVYAAEVPQSTALGAALAIHNCWNSRRAPQQPIKLKQYQAV